MFAMYGVENRTFCSILNNNLSYNTVDGLLLTESYTEFTMKRKRLKKMNFTEVDE